MKYYPAFLNLRGKKCVVVGGGKVARRKLGPLLQAGAEVIVISPKITPEIKKLALEKQIAYKKKVYRDSDLDDAFLVIGATNLPNVNRRIHAFAEKNNLLANIVDHPDLCNFIVPSLFSRGHLQIAISTGGISPSLSQKIRKELGQTFGRDYARFLNFLAKLRPTIITRVKDPKRRQQILRKLASSEFYSLVQRRKLKRAQQLAHRLITTR